MKIKGWLNFFYIEAAHHWVYHRQPKKPTWQGLAGEKDHENHGGGKLLPGCNRHHQNDIRIASKPWLVGLYQGFYYPVM